MDPKRKFRFQREVYLILAGVLLLALAIQLTHSEYILKFSENEHWTGQEGQKFQRVDPAGLVSSESPFCLAFDSDDNGSVMTNGHVRMTLQYMKKPVKITDLATGPLDTAGCQAVIASAPELGKLGDPDRLSEYVAQGGYVFLTRKAEVDQSYYRLYSKLGIINTGNSISDARGIKITSPVLIGEEGLLLDEDYITNDINPVELSSDSRVLATTASGVPLMWDCPYGKGKFMVFNGSMLQEKLSRGMVAGGIGLLVPDFIYPVFNSKVLFIDDFPAPIPLGRNEEIYRQYRRDLPAFFHDIWWPQMLQAAKKYDARYTAVLIQSYHDDVEPPFEQPADEDEKGLISYGREVIKSGGEIGIHGYNHQSLVMDPDTAGEFGYNAWGSIESMAASVKEVVRFFRQSFLNYDIVTYVPPSNVLLPEGREALKQGWPGLSVISSLYGEDASGLSYVQEFEIAADGILEMPRVTSGYMDVSFDHWAEANVMTSLGLYSHFLHPDDLLDEERNGHLDWERLYEKYTGLLARVQRTYPWLRSMTAAEAAEDMGSVLTSKLDWTRDGSTLKGTIGGFIRPAYFIMRTERKFGKLQNCTVRKIDDGTYLIRANRAEFQLELRD